MARTVPERGPEGTQKLLFSVPGLPALILIIKVFQLLQGGPGGRIERAVFGCGPFRGKIHPPLARGKSNPSLARFASCARIERGHWGHLVLRSVLL